MLLFSNVKLLAVVVTLSLLSNVRSDEKGPNGGVLYEGAKHKYHIEIKVDSEKKSVTAYILDDKAKTAVPIKAKTITMKIKGVKEPVTLTAVESKGADTFSQFKGKADVFGGKLDWAGINVIARIEDGKPEVTFELDD